MTSSDGAGSDPAALAHLRYRDVLDELKVRDDRWEIQQSPGYLAVRREWENGTTDSLLVFDATTAYGFRECPPGRLVWELRATPQKVIDAVHELAAPVASDAPPNAGGPMAEGDCR
jgi:hypothetical protein